jgi:hypothetical protein
VTTHKLDTQTASGSWKQIVRTIALGLLIVGAYLLLQWAGLHAGRHH